MIKKLLLIPLLLGFLSCDKECKEQRDQINQQYSEALQNAATPAAVQEITRQRDAKLAELDC